MFKLECNRFSQDPRMCFQISLSRNMFCAHCGLQCVTMIQTHPLGQSVPLFKSICLAFRVRLQVILFGLEHISLLRRQDNSLNDIHASLL